MIYKTAILAYVVLYTGIALGLRSIILYRNTGINPFKKMGKGGVQGINEKTMMIGASLVPVISTFYLISEDIYDILVPIKYLEISWLRNIGLSFMLIGSLLAIIAQFQMGNSWRMGINKSETTDLIKHRLFKYSRNPIYLGLLISFLGFFLTIPNAISLSCIVLAYPSFEIKVRLEEQYLLEKHGSNFTNYLKSVKRWI